MRSRDSWPLAGPHNAISSWQTEIVSVHRMRGSRSNIGLSSGCVPRLLFYREDLLFQFAAMQLLPKNLLKRSARHAAPDRVGARAVFDSAIRSNRQPGAHRGDQSGPIIFRHAAIILVVGL